MCTLCSWNSYADCNALDRFFICLRPDTKRCKPHGTPSTWPLEDQEFYMSFSLADSHSYPGKIYSQKAFPSGTPGTFQHWTVQHNGTEIFKVPLDSVIFTRSVRGLDEICTRWGFCKARQQGKAAGIFSTLPFSALRLSNHFYSSISSILFSTLLFYSSTLLFYCSLFCVSQAIEKPSPWVSISKRICLKNMRAPAKC